MIFDIIILGALVLATINGWRSGALAMLLSLVILILAIVLASAFAGAVGGALGVGPSWSRTVIGFLLSFILLLIAGNWIKHFFRPKRGILRGFDGIAGAALGCVRSVLGLSCLLAIANLVHLPPESVTQKSLLYSPMLKTSSVLIGVLRPYIHTNSVTV